MSINTERISRADLIIYVQENFDGCTGCSIIESAANQAGGQIGGKGSVHIICRQQWKGDAPIGNVTAVGYNRMGQDLGNYEETGDCQALTPDNS